jgi:hypothetical protein
MWACLAGGVTRGHGGVNVTLAPEEGAEERAVPTRKGGGRISRTGA